MKWLYSSAIYTALAASLFFTGCSEDTPEACAYGVEQDLDQGRYNDVIANLAANPTCDGEMTADEANMAKGAAYMQKAGLTLSELASTVLDSNETDPTAAFMTAFADKANSEVLQSLSSADAAYALVVGDVNCTDDNATKTAVESSACFYQNLATTVQTVSIMAASLGDAVSFLTTPVVQGDANDTNNNGTADAMEITGCAIADASTTTGTNVTCSTESTVKFTVGSLVQFTDLNVTPRTFNVTNVTAHADYVEVKMMTALSPVTTNGVCTADYVTTTCNDTVNIAGGCYPCPVVVDGGAVESTEVVVDAINEGAIEGVTPDEMEQTCYDAETALITAGTPMSPVHLCDTPNDTSADTSDSQGTITDIEFARIMTLQQ